MMGAQEKAMWKWARIGARFRKELLLAWAILRESRSPVAAKLATIAAVLYVISPVDWIPDVLPVLGWLDDGVVAVLLLKLAQRLLPTELLAALKARLDAPIHPAIKH
jgi:uncharacterized membrane protein YkvA (DUF1232 family)